MKKDINCLTCNNTLVSEFVMKERKLTLSYVKEWNLFWEKKCRECDKDFSKWESK
jgi:hypothetical protein